MKLAIEAAAARGHPSVALLSNKVNRITWGEESSEFEITAESDVRGLGFSGYKGGVMVFIIFVAEGPLGEGPSDVDRVSTVLKRIEGYAPEPFAGIY